MKNFHSAKVMKVFFFMEKNAFFYLDAILKYPLGCLCGVQNCGYNKNALLGSKRIHLLF